MNPDEAVVVRIYANEADAIVAASRLGSEGMETFIRKDDCGGAYPSLQMAGGVRLLVGPDDLAAAEAILKEMDAQDSEQVEHKEEQKDRGGKTSWPMAVVRGVFLFLSGLAAGYVLSFSPVDPDTFTGVKKYDRNEQGKPGTFHHYTNGQRKVVEEDRNYDGKPDARHKYVTDKLRTSWYDNNFDGEPDAWVTYKDLFNYVTKVDTDFDGKPDATVFYVNGLKQRVDWHPKDSPLIERRELYEHDVLKEALVDTDGDGIFDLRITYDRYERPTGKTKCHIPN